MGRKKPPIVTACEHMVETATQIALMGHTMEDATVLCDACVEALAAGDGLELSEVSSEANG